MDMPNISSSGGNRLGIAGGVGDLISGRNRLGIAGGVGDLMWGRNRLGIAGGVGDLISGNGLGIVGGVDGVGPGFVIRPEGALTVGVCSWVAVLPGASDSSSLTTVSALLYIFLR